MSWFDEQGLPGGSIAPIESGYAPQGGWGGGRVLTDEERERMRQELIAATGGQWNPDPNTPPMAKMPLDLTVGAPPSYGNDPAGVATEPWGRPGDMHNPGWGIERPNEPMPAPSAPYMPPPQGGGTLGAVGMGQPQQPSTIQQIMAGNGGRNALSGAFGGMFGGAGKTTSALGFGQAPTAALQSASGYGGGVGGALGGYAGGGGVMMRSPTGMTKQVPRQHLPFYQQRGATEVR